MSTPVGTYESRHVTQLAEGDLVWDETLGRWRRVTSALRYTTERTKQDMVKIVLDISAYHRHVAGDDVRYDVLLDDHPRDDVAPESASARRRRLRGKAADEPQVAPSTVTTEPAVVAATPPADGVRPAGDVRARREALGIARAKFAELAGMTAGALWRVEDGRPKDDELERVMRALEQREAAS